MGVMTDYMLVKNQLPVREWVPTILQIRKYAEASGDFNPIHLDEEYEITNISPYEGPITLSNETKKVVVSYKAANSIFVDIL